MEKTVFLTGASGLLGQLVLQRLQEQPCQIQIGTRSPNDFTAPLVSQYFDLDQPMDQLTLQGVDTIVHLASNTKDHRANSDQLGTQSLLQIAKRDGVQRILFMSIVGLEQVPLNYFRTKKRVEEDIQQSGLAYKILRATQFFPFFEREIQKQLVKGVAIVPNLLYQPISVAAVADTVVRQIFEPFDQSISAIGGPQKVHFAEAIRSYRDRVGGKTRVIGIPNAWLGQLGQALTTESIRPDSIDWQTYLEKVSR